MKRVKSKYGIFFFSIPCKSQYISLIFKSLTGNTAKSEFSVQRTFVPKVYNRKKLSWKNITILINLSERKSILYDSIEINNQSNKKCSKLKYSITQIIEPS